ncbi:carboxymuconolactone decarboxylase family protein [Streptomyces sp. NBC_00401]|uniref:carboxymuconolactone decarboxylase family protein n=1 Tax=unclassified Streptomyces TaxID=2593676 RepID=UPI002254C1D0|nr:carboxymuconolactone decarboxylase family protein [Streptomyces sp. NBC_00401]MCX5085804.1 carboxymuconolactone decarboxylase family protein [Streptomyces sp. NBC_00401]
MMTPEHHATPDRDSLGMETPEHHAGPGGRDGARTVTPRIPPLPAEEWPPVLRDLLGASSQDGPGRVNLFGTLAHHPPLAEAWLRLAQVLTHQGTLAMRDRELAILRTSHRLGCDFVRARHEEHARLAGLTTADVAATASPALSPHRWHPADLAVLRTADLLADHAELPEALWQELAERLRAEQLVELLLVIGQCAMACTTLNTLGTPPDATSPVPSLASPKGRLPA